MANADLIDSLAQLLAPAIDRQKALQFGIKHDSPGVPTQKGFLHGPGGLLTYPGVDPDVFSTQVGFISLLDQLPAVASVDMYPTFLTLTGVGDDVGSEKDEVCDDAMVAGILSGCMLTSVFGRYERATPELELNRLGQRNNRADP